MEFVETPFLPSRWASSGWREEAILLVALLDAEQRARVMEAFDLNFSGSEEVSVFDGPSLIVAGRHNTTSGYLDAVDLMHPFPRATLAVLDTAGHTLAWERPRVFNALARDWLNRLVVTPSNSSKRLHRAPSQTESTFNIKQRSTLQELQIRS